MSQGEDDGPLHGYPLYLHIVGVAGSFPPNG